MLWVAQYFAYRQRAPALFTRVPVALAEKLSMIEDPSWSSLLRSVALATKVRPSSDELGLSNISIFNFLKASHRAWSSVRISRAMCSRLFAKSETCVVDDDAELLVGPSTGAVNADCIPNTGGDNLGFFQFN